MWDTCTLWYEKKKGEEEAEEAAADTCAKAWECVVKKCSLC